MYVFDPLGDRAFFMELNKIEFGKDIDKAVCVKSTGEAPAQTLNFDELLSKTNTAVISDDEDFNEDFYGSEGYNEDDIDLDGYDINNIADSSYSDDLY
jgi:hypothetical protein